MVLGYDFISNVGYNSIADICSIVICLIYAILLNSTYTEQNLSLHFFKLANIGIIISSICNITYHSMCNNLTEERVISTYILHDSTYIVLAFVFVLFIFYLINYVQMKTTARYCMYAYVSISFTIYFIAEIVDDFTQTGFYITDSGHGVHQSFFGEPFRYYYVACALAIIVFFVFYKKRFITRMYRALILTMFASFSLMIIQNFFRQTSFTIITFVIPLVTVLFLFHYNSYDQETGSLDEKAFNAYVANNSRKSQYGFICLLLLDMDEGKMAGISEEFFHFNERYFKNPITFRLMNNHILLAYDKDKNPDCDEQLKYVVDDFCALYDKHRIDYKIIIGNSYDDFETGIEYVEFIRYIEGKILDNSIYYLSDSDYEAYNHLKFVKSVIEDIHRKNNMSDERVRVFCQPVYNTITRKFTTAEALMRIVLDDGTMLFPDEFIPIAENNNFIHTLSRIILDKVCKAIKGLENEGYLIDRISVNISAQELKLPGFCQQVEQIIKDNGVDFGKIAIELTESRNDSDFETMKAVISRLRESGIVFYLDDFGTGYSNFERILGLPMDIIKFDRSLTIMSSQNDNYRYMVGSFSDIFKNSNYCILFEGVEDENDEIRCTGMNAKYLQGYKYSKPIPIEKLKDFLDFVPDSEDKMQA